MKYKWQIVIGITLIVLVCLCSLSIGYNWGYGKGRDFGQPETKVQTKLFRVHNYILEREGYFLEWSEEHYELKYIEEEGWFLKDENSYPPLLHRLEVWLNEHTPDNRYIYKFFSEGHIRGTISLYLARP